MAKVIEFLRLLDKDDLGIAVLKLFVMAFCSIALVIFIAMAFAAWTLALGVCT